MRVPPQHLKLAFCLGKLALKFLHAGFQAGVVAL
jgi:hypothetical protein